MISFLRYPRTQQERRENTSLNSNSDAREYKITYRGSRSRRQLPTHWWDLGRSGNRSWKEQRINRWK